MRGLFKFFFSWQIPEINEKFRPHATLFVWVFGIIFITNLFLFYHYIAFLGPGLGDEATTSVLVSIFDTLKQNADTIQSRFLLLFFCVSIIVCVLFRFCMFILSYTYYEKVYGKKFPIKDIVTFMLTNAVSTLSMIPMLLMLGLFGSLMGFDFSDGWNFTTNAANLANQWVVDYVPTLFELPSVIALLLVYTVAGLAHYWLHRLGHTQRLFWLLFHRHHHMPSRLHSVTTQAVFVPVPLFIFAVIPYVFVFGAITKLFSAEPLFVEIFCLSIFLQIPEIFGHQTALYDKARKSKIIRYLSFFYSGGVYHYIHHSAKVEHSRKGSNMVNIGGGFFYIWDIVFGTYSPLTKVRPKVGLTNSPDLHMNPFRLSYSGMMQIVYELVNNKNFKQRLLILFGPSSYTPPISKDFAIINH